MTPPFVSVVIPTYDRVGMVEAAILSVLRQDYEHLEVIVVDDGSHDETPALLERIAEQADPERFRYKVQANTGQAVAINQAWAASRGDLIGYVSSDDYLLPGAIAKLVAAAEAHPEADVFYPWELIVDEADRTIDVLEHLTHDYVDAIRWAQCSIGVGALVRRSRFEKTGGWDETLRLIPDLDWWLRMHDATFVCVPEALGARRRHDGSISVAMDAHADLDEWLRVLDQVFARDDLPAGVLAVKNQAYSSALMHSVHQLQIRDPATLDDPRYLIQDLVSPRYAVAHRESIADERARILAGLRSAEDQLGAQLVIVGELRGTVEALTAAAVDREARVAALEAQAEAARAELQAVADERDAARAELVAERNTPRGLFRGRR
jgi:glycosyltransferase involved in cell wall biosynthesis